MPLARFFLYAQGVDIWAAPTLASGDGWVSSLRHVATESGCFVIGVNPCLHIDQIPTEFPHRERLCSGRESDPWIESGNSVIISPYGDLLAGPLRHAESILVADVDLDTVHAARRRFDPVGHYHRPDVFRLSVDTRPRPAVVVTDGL